MLCLRQVKTCFGKSDRMTAQGDLESYAKFSKHYSGDSSYKGNFLTPETQPGCIQKLYQEAEQNPVCIIHDCNNKRPDPCTLCLLVPVFKDGTYKEPDADFEVKPQLLPQTEDKLSDDDDDDNEVEDIPEVFAPCVEVNNQSGDDPGTEESKENVVKPSHPDPADLVPIDISGATFNRMCEYRESVRSSSREYIKVKTVKRRKRRQTFSGTPDLVFNEISTKLFNMNHLSSQVSLRSRSISRERPKSAALESYAPRTGSKAEMKKIKEREKRKTKQDPEETNLARSCSLRRSLKSLFKNKRSKSSGLWAEGRPSSPGPPVVDLAYPMKRSKSLPKSLRSSGHLANDQLEFDRERSASTEGRLDTRTEEHTKEAKTDAQMMKERNKIPRSISHNAALSGSTFVDHLSRPKSMDVGPQAFSGSLYPGSASSQMVPSSESITSSITQDGHVIKSKHIHISIPDKPWTKPFAKVKLRFHRKQKREVKDDRQSSSGHWSASSSSARHSMDSDSRRSASSPDRLSFCDKDSAVSLNIHTSPGRSTGKISEETSAYGDGDSSTLNGSSSGNDSIVDMKKGWTKKEHWSKPMSSNKTTLNQPNHVGGKTVTSEYCLTAQNLKVHNDVHQPLTKGFSCVGDDESSIYSIDQDGFYTSMHKDCGLKKGIDDVLPENAEEFSSNTVSDGGNAANDKTLNRKVPMRRKGSSAKLPPPPPRRISTLSNKSNASSRCSSEDSPPKTELQKLSELAQRIAAQKEREASLRGKRTERSPSCESDAESIFARVKMKSAISPSVIPTLCPVTPIQTDDEDVDLLGVSNGQKCQPGLDAIKYRRYMDSLKSSKSAPGTLDCLTPLQSSLGSLVPSSPPAPHNQNGSDQRTDGSYSTWPRSPSNKHNREKQLGDKLIQPSECLGIISPKLDVFCASKKFNFADSGHALPEAITPDSVVEDRVFDSPTNNTFKGPQVVSVVTEKVCDIRSIYSALASKRSANYNTVSEKSVDRISTWPRRKGVTFLTSSQPVSKDDSLIITNKMLAKKSGIIKKNSGDTFPRKGDHAHFISIKCGEIKVPASLPFSDQPLEQQMQAAHAKLVISSPVANRACFVENPYKRSVCSPVTATDLLKFWNYTSSDVWYSTMPRSSRKNIKQSFSFSTAEDIQRLRYDKEADVTPVNNQMAKSVLNADSTKPLDGDLSDISRPPSKPLFPSISAMKHALNFPGAPKKRAEPTNYGRTWYDGIDAASTVVVMSPDGTQGMRGAQTSFAAFLKDQAPGSSFGMRHRRDSTTSSISTNSSSSGRKSVTFAAVHRTSSSSLSRTSLDATSITSSQLSGDTISDRRSLHSIISDDSIQITPQKRNVLSLFQPRDSAHTLSSCLKRSSSNGSSELRANPTLETIIGSDSETPHNLSEDHSFDDVPLCNSESPNGSQTVGPSVVEPSAKRQKVNIRSKSSNFKHRSGSQSRGKNFMVSTSFVGPSVKMESDGNTVCAEIGNEIKPMPLISTSFIGAFKKESTDENIESGSLLRNVRFPNKTLSSQDAKQSKTIETQDSAAATLQSKYLASSGNKTWQQNDKLMDAQPDGVLLKQQGSGPHKPCGVGPEVKNSTDQSSNMESNKPVASSSSSSSLSSFTVSTSSWQSASSVSSSQCVHTLSVPKLSSTSVVSSASNIIKNIIVSSSSCSSFSSSLPSSVSSSLGPTSVTSALCSSQVKPTPAKFVLPKLRPWNPPNLSNSRTSTLLSQLSAVATQGASFDKSATTNDEQLVDVSQRPCEPVNKPTDSANTEAASGSTKTKIQNDSGDCQKACSRKENKSPSTNQSSNCDTQSVNDSLSETSSQREDEHRMSKLSRSSCSLNRWSTADIGSSALSLARSTSSLAGLNLSSTSLNKSCLSLAKSTDSLRSASSTAGQTRAAKLAFFNSDDVPKNHENAKGSVEQRFAKLSGSQKGASSGKVCRQAAADTNGHKTKSFLKSANNHSQQSSSAKKSIPSHLGLKGFSPKASPIQGKFVSSILGKLHKKGINTSLTKVSQSATTQK